MSDDPKQDISDWWRTSIIRMEPNQIDIRGTPIQDLIGHLSFAQMIWLMLRGDMPTDGQSSLLEAALTAAVDHGPQAPSIAAARMAASCGVGLNNALATGVNMLGDVHGGAGQQAVAMFNALAASPDPVATALPAWQAQHGKMVPGFGHRFHQIDPRVPRLMALVADATSAGHISGEIHAIARAVEAHLATGKTPVPMNIDGATAVIYAELGFPAELARGLFCLSRSVGILAHSWEQMQQGERNKGPMPKGYLWTYRDDTD